jgi:hypothetical protein
MRGGPGRVQREEVFSEGEVKVKRANVEPATVARSPVGGKTSEAIR